METRRLILLIILLILLINIVLMSYTVMQQRNEVAHKNEDYPENQASSGRISITIVREEQNETST